MFRKHLRLRSYGSWERERVRCPGVQTTDPGGSVRTQFSLSGPGSVPGTPTRTLSSLGGGREPHVAITSSEWTGGDNELAEGFLSLFSLEGPTGPGGPQG